MFWLIARFLFFPTLAWNLLLGRILRLRPWWNHVDDYLIIGALPLKRDVPALVALGVKAVVNTCEEYQGPVAAYEQAGIVQLRIPTIDFTHPSLDSVERGVAFIEQHMKNREVVYVHCKAGRGRSATIVLCWLIRARQMSPAQGQKLLQEKRPHVNKYLLQRPVVNEFYKLCQKST